MRLDDYKLFTIGPTQMYRHTLDVRSKVVPYFRTPEFSELMLDNERLIKKLQFASEDSKAVFLTASGSGAMEATVINCFDQHDKLLIICGGTFFASARTKLSRPSIFHSSTANRSLVCW